VFGRSFGTAAGAAAGVAAGVAAGGRTSVPPLTHAPLNLSDSQTRHIYFHCHPLSWVIFGKKIIFGNCTYLRFTFQQYSTVQFNSRHKFVRQRKEQWTPFQWKHLLYILTNNFFQLLVSLHSLSINYSSKSEQPLSTMYTINIVPWEGFLNIFC